VSRFRTIALQECFTDLLAPRAEAPPTAASAGSSFSSTSSSHGSSGLPARMRAGSGGSGSGTFGRPPSHHAQRAAPALAATAAAAPAPAAAHKVTVRTAASADELKALVHARLLKRRIASTSVNDKSSRSHVIITISVEQRKQVAERRTSQCAAAGLCSPPPPSPPPRAAVAAGGDAAAAAWGAGSCVDASDTQSVAEDFASVADSDAGSDAGGISTYLIGCVEAPDGGAWLNSLHGVSCTWQPRCAAAVCAPPCLARPCTLCTHAPAGSCT
jgi:hypothetical protein